MAKKDQTKLGPGNVVIVTEPERVSRIVRVDGVAEIVVTNPAGDLVAVIRERGPDTNLIDVNGAARDEWKAAHDENAWAKLVASLGGV